MYAEQLVRQARWEADLLRSEILSDVPLDQAMPLAGRAVKSAEQAAVTLDRLAPAVERAAAAARDSLSHPSLPLEKYVGTYRDPWYGDIQVRKRGSGLELVMLPTPSLIGRLDHWQYDTFVVRWDDRELRADAYVTFALQPTGGIDRVTMKAASPSVDFSYDFQDLNLTPVR